MKNYALLIENYLGMMEHLPEADKLEIIIRLSKTLKSKHKNASKPKPSNSLFGALNDTEAAEDWIARIRSGRSFNRKTEAL